MTRYVVVFYLDPSGNACRYESEKAEVIDNDGTMFMVVDLNGEFEFQVPVTRLVEVRIMREKPVPKIAEEQK